jgi:metallophosphoesterase (TIGR00282 family)
MTYNILAVGDIVGENGIDFFASHLSPLKKHYNVSFTVVNGENASGIGITPQQAELIFSAGADVVTLGNHAFGRREIEDYLDSCSYILRPANFAPQTPGRGWGDFEAPFGTVRVISLAGRCGMPFGPDNPFFEADRILKNNSAAVVLIDMHAEATSEKAALAYYLDGRATALWGTHTHVQTSDARVFPKGLGFITDLGMTGPADSVIGIKPEQSVSLFLGNPPRRHQTAPGHCKLEGAVFEINAANGRCVSVEAIRIT